MSNHNSPLKYKVSAKEKQFFDDNGYLIIRELFDTKACDNMRSRFRQLVDREVPRGKIAIVEDLELKKQQTNPEDYVNKINLLSYDPEFVKYTEDPRLLDVMSQFLFDGSVIFNSMLINKPPGSPWHPPHQSYVNTLFFSIKDLDNIAPSSKRVALLMKPGDTVFLHSLLVHGSFPNITKSYRKAITCIYASEECEYIDLKNTVQEPFMNEFSKELRSRGYEFERYNDYWKYRSKKIQKSKL